MNFGEALDRLKAGWRVQRTGWNGRGMWIRIPLPYIVRDGPGAEGIHTSRSFIEMKDAQGCFVPWLASQTDLLASDWSILE